MNEEEIERISGHIERTWTSKMCPHCGSKDWGIGQVSWLVPMGEDGMFDLTQGAEPVVSVICGHCGNTVLINLIAAGFEPSEFEPED